MLAKTDFPIGLDAKTREAFNKTFDAMSEWRDETTASTERYAERVFDTFAVAARGVGWPEGLVETTKIQLLQASKMQTQMMDHLMETWQDQLKSPVSPGQLLGKFTQGGSGTGLDNAMANPAQFWMQTTQMWQKNWMDAMALWMGGKAYRR
jgi:hypothetical protein